MTIENTATIDQEKTAALQQLIVEALRKGEGGTLVRKVLAEANLTPEHQALVDMFLQGEHGRSEETESSAVVLEETEDLDVLRQELADLRQANDTLAAALGACPYCWGGDRHCRVCHGRGRSGHAPPDPALYNEWVMPAVRRARAIQGPGPRPGLARARA